jgi:hypothetical protein
MQLVSSWKERSRLAVIIAMAAVGFALILTSAPRVDAQAAPSVQIKQVTLTGAEENPPTTTNGIGYFSATLTDGNLEFDLSGVAPEITAAHIHLGAKGVNGPAVAFLFGPATDPVGAIHPTGNIKAANLVGPLAGNWKGLTDAMAKGELYVNIHTVASPGGALRVQIPATTLAPLPPKTGDGLVSANGLGLTQGLGVAMVIASLVTLTFAVSRRRA